jgi:hypothetical protein
MGKLYESITPDLREWLAAQKVFFVATAPLSAEGHINCSPKGGDALRVLSQTEVAYLDLTGSGIETTAHLQENSRIVLMFCSFEAAPKIVRLHGTGRVVYPSESEFQKLRDPFASHAGVRGIIRVTINRISDSCGHGVPIMQFVQQRDLIEKWSVKKGATGLAEYRASKNATSIDGIAGYRLP